jgi:hypothetical protein
VPGKIRPRYYSQVAVCVHALVQAKAEQRWEMFRLREAMRLFEERGPQKVQEN